MGAIPFILIYIANSILMRKSVASGATSSAKGTKFSAKAHERPGISEGEVQEIKEAFDLFDHDGTGRVFPKDLKSALDSLGPEAKTQTIYQMISDLHADGGGPIDFEEFLQLMTSRVSDKDSRENIRKVFNLFDEEKTGFISIKSLRKVVRELGESIEEHELQ